MNTRNPRKPCMGKQTIINIKYASQLIEYALIQFLRAIYYACGKKTSQNQ